MRAVSILGKQLPRISSPYQSRTRYLPATFTCAAQVRSRSPNKRRGPHLRCDQDGGGQCYRSTQLAVVVYCAQQRRHSAGHGLRKGHHNPCLLYPRRPEAIPVQARIYTGQDFQHVLQFDLYPPECLFSHRDSPYLPSGSAQHKPEQQHLFGSDQLGICIPSAQQ
jgi:hypothetical protein